MTTPKAFLCHSSEDHDVVKQLATDLMAAGVDTWYYEWEIHGGDSLRRKVDEGIAGCDYFVPVLSPRSLQSEWVQVELDAALIQRIEGQCKLLPVILDLGFKDLPPLLKGMGGIRLTNYSEGLQNLINDLHGLSVKPPLGNPPAMEVIEGSGLSVNATAVAVHIAKSDAFGAVGFVVFESSDLQSATQLSADLLAEAIDELEEEGLIHVTRYMNDAPSIMAEDRLFWLMDASVMGWNPEADALHLLGVLVNYAQEIVDMEELSAATTWAARRLNPAVTFLECRGSVEAPESTGPGPFAFDYVKVTPRTRRLAKEQS